MADAVASSGPLEGVTVLDLSTVGPAARCTRLLADYGARVVKVGPVPMADATPIQPQFFAYSGHRGMRRVLLDLKDTDGKEAFLALAAAADVVVESFRPGVVDRLGIGYDAVSARNSGIIYCATTGYGQDGPHAQWAGHDIDYLAVGGYLAMSTPGADGVPPLPGATVADAAAGGMQAALAITAALAGRAGSGRGAYLDVSVAEGVLWLMSLPVDEHLALGTDRDRATTCCRAATPATPPTRRRRQVGGRRGDRGEVLRQPLPCAGVSRAGRLAARRRPRSRPFGPPSPPPSPPAAATSGSRRWRVPTPASPRCSRSPKWPGTPSSPPAAR